MFVRFEIGLNMHVGQFENNFQKYFKQLHFSFLKCLLSPKYIYCRVFFGVTLFCIWNTTEVRIISQNSMSWFVTYTITIFGNRTSLECNPPIFIPSPSFCCQTGSISRPQSLSKIDFCHCPLHRKWKVPSACLGKSPSCYLTTTK